MYKITKKVSKRFKSYVGLAKFTGGMIKITIHHSKVNVPFGRRVDYHSNKELYNRLLEVINEYYMIEQSYPKPKLNGVPTKKYEEGCFKYEPE